MNILRRLGVIKPFISRLTFNNGGSSSLDSTPEHHAMPKTPASAWNEWSGGVIANTNAIKEKSVTKWTVWWNSLDFYNKVFATIFIVLIGIPVLLVISLILGNVVASLI